MGLLASVALPANVVTEVYACPEDYQVSFNVRLCNRGAAGTVRLALTAGGEPTDASWIEYGCALPQAGVLENTGFHFTAGQRIFAWASVNTVSVNVIGVPAAA